jgi:DNA invertase Pin-like site-specific DNA recombinase
VVYKVDRLTRSLADFAKMVEVFDARGVEMRIILDGNDDVPRKVDPALLKAIARAHRWFDELASGHMRSLAEIARREGIGKHYVARLTRLALVAPGIVEAVAQGRTPTALNLQMLMTSRVTLPLEWKEQERLLALE